MEQRILVFGEPVAALPKDLYIPPDALRVLLETFEGPLDLLLYLIRRQKIDILDIQVSLITKQYVEYVEKMRELDINLAAEYLLMAATLANLKARMLLPKMPENSEDDDDYDPRAELAELLLRYSQTVKAAQQLAKQARIDSGLLLSAIKPSIEMSKRIKPDCSVLKLREILTKLKHKQVVKKAHQVQRENFSLSERISLISKALKKSKTWQPLTNFYQQEEGRAGKVVSLMAMLELDREQIIQWEQQQYFAAIQLKAR